MKKKLVLASISLIVILAGVFCSKAIMTGMSDELFRANLEALSQNEGYNPQYKNAKYVYCDDTDRLGCKGQLFRNCEGPFCN